MSQFKTILKSFFEMTGRTLQRSELAELSLKNRLELSRLARSGQHSVNTSFLPGYEVSFPSAAVFSTLYTEIFVQERYRFKSDRSVPFVIDCGANIGLLSLYTKQLYPNAEVTCFEPDPTIYRYLKSNIQSSGYQNVHTIGKGVWDKKESATFSVDQDSTAGSVIVGDSARATIEVELTDIRDHLTREVDFLKIDVEGAELRVLESIKCDLHNVANIFVEYHCYEGQEQCLGKLVSLLEDSGFRLFLDRGNPKRQSPLIETPVHKGMEFFVDIFGKRM